jgi:hypothetical protein
MNGMIAFCGLDCHDCGALLATKDNEYLFSVQAVRP